MRHRCPKCAGHVTRAATLKGGSLMLNESEDGSIVVVSGVARVATDLDNGIRYTLHGQECYRRRNSRAV